MNKIVVFDMETGGTQPNHPTIQIAAIAVDENWKEVDSFECKIAFDPDMCDPEALKLNHYTAEAWKGATVDPFPRFASFLKRHATVKMTSKRTGNPYMVARLAAYNQEFDKPRLWAMADGQFVPAHPQVFCILQRSFWWSLETGFTPDNFKQTTVAAALGITTDGAHDALADVRMAAEIARKIGLAFDTSMNFPLPKEEPCSIVIANSASVVAAPEK